MNNIIDYWRISRFGPHGSGVAETELAGARPYGSRDCGIGEYFFPCLAYNDHQLSSRTLTQITGGSTDVQAWKVRAAAIPGIETPTRFPQP